MMKTIAQPHTLWTVLAWQRTTGAFKTLLSATLAIMAFEPFTAMAEKAAADKTDKEAALRLQVFLDRAEFAPGKIDGHHGEFTLKALALYRQAQVGKPSLFPEKTEPKSNATPDVSGLDLASVDPLFITYTVTESDIQAIGDLPDAVPAQAKLKALPYRTAAENVAEKFHTDLDYLHELNPGKTKSLKAGDQLTVPNVEPFDLTKVKNLKIGNEMETQASNDIEDDAPKKANPGESAAMTTEVKIDIATNMLAVYEGGGIIAAYPVTVGSKQTESPVGEWKIRGVATMPIFRYDKEMLKEGERSDNFHILPPGPNSPVGVIWIGLNKKGIGLHGTSDPESIGRSSSHGCVRMANWDVVRLARKVKSGVPVSIR